MSESRPRILLVEDDEPIRLVLIDLLAESGFDVLAASCGDAALPLLTNPDHIDLLFTDVQMPGEVDGVDLAMYARKKFPTVPILISSGFAKRLGSRLQKLDPPTAFISKPFKLDYVVSKVEELIKAA